MERWNKRVAIVTGANSGIGYATAEKLVENGLKVVGLDIREDKLKTLEAESKNKKGEFYGRIADISKKDDIIEAFRWTENNIGPVSVVVNNAGVNICLKVSDCDFDSWKKMVDTNLYGVMIGCGLGLKQMKEHNIEDGHIININSVGGHSILNMEGVSFYLATKYGVTAFTLAMRKELAQEKSKIRFTSISPGFVVSGMTGQSKFSSQLDNLPSVYPEDVANGIISVLASPPHVQITELTIQPTTELY